MKGDGIYIQFDFPFVGVDYRFSTPNEMTSGRIV